MGTSISIEITNNKPKALTNNEKININNINSMINDYDYKICKLNGPFNSAILFSLYKEMATSLYQSIECEKLIPNDDITNVEQNERVNINENIINILNNMNNHLNVRFQNKPDDAIFNPFLIIMLSNFFFPIIKVDGENKELDNEYSEYSVLLSKAMYKDPELYINNAASALDPKFMSFSKPHFIKFANKLKTASINENIIMGNLVKFIYLLLIAVTILGSKCGDETKLNKYVDDYIEKPIDTNNTLDDEYINLILKEGTITSYIKPTSQKKQIKKAIQQTNNKEEEPSIAGTLYGCCYCCCYYIICFLVIYALTKLMSKK